MMLLAKIFAGLVMIIHVYIFLLETVMFRTRGVKAFQIEPELVDRMSVLFSNQGCYNGFLAAALLLGFILPDPAGTAMTYYGLGCVAVAGIWGAVTVKKSILYIQTIPATLGLVTLMLAG
jgi:putative membrane protein